MRDFGLHSCNLSSPFGSKNVFGGYFNPREVFETPPQPKLVPCLPRLYYVFGGQSIFDTCAQFSILKHAG